MADSRWSRFHRTRFDRAVISLVEALCLGLVSPRSAPAQPAAPQFAAVQSHGIGTFAFTPDGEKLVGGGEDGKVHVWTAADGTELRTFDSGERRIQAMHLFADGASVQIADRSVRTLGLADGEERSSTPLDLDDPKHYMQLHQFSADGQLLVGRVGLSPGQVVVWSAVTGHIRHRVDVPGVPLAVAFSPDAKLLAIGTIATQDPPSQGAVHLYDLGAGALRRTLEVQPYSISSVAFSPDGKLVAGGDHRQVRLWDVESGELRATLHGHSGPVEALVFSPDGMTLASGGEGPTQRAPREWRRLSEVKVWNVADAYLLESYVGLVGRTCAIAYSPDGKRLARTDGGRLVCEQRGDARNWAKDFDSTVIAVPAN